jgi:hypothetical protein
MEALQLAITKCGLKLHSFVYPPSLHYRHPSGNPLHLAVRFAQPEVVEYLCMPSHHVIHPSTFAPLSF